MTPAQLQQLCERFPVGSINTLPADEVHRLLAHISTLESELQQVRVERDGLREALVTIRDHERPFLGTECRAIAGAALTPAPAARTEEPL